MRSLDYSSCNSLGSSRKGLRWRWVMTAEIRNNIANKTAVIIVVPMIVKVVLAVMLVCWCQTGPKCRQGCVREFAEI